MPAYYIGRNYARYGDPDPETNTERSTEDYAWMRSRDHRHRLAHYFNFAPANTAYYRETVRSVCNQMWIKPRELTHYKEYKTKPNRVCTSCELWIYSKLMKEIAR